MEIVIWGEAGLSGCRALCGDKERYAALRTRYSELFLDGLFDAAGEKSVPCGMAEEGFRSCADGGVFAALWELLHAHRCGGDFRQCDIPIRQQVVEICSFFGLNPFRLAAEDTYVCLTEEGDRLVQQARAAGAAAAVIGCTAKGPAIRRTDGEEIAYLRKS